MLRQIHIFHGGNHIFTHSLATGISNEELMNIKSVLQSYIDMPMPNKTFQRPLSNFLIFHRGFGTTYFLLVCDLVDSIDFVDDVFKKIIERFKEFFPNPSDIGSDKANEDAFKEYMNLAQHNLHSKIAIIGPIQSGKTTLYNLLKSGQERSIMNFAKATSFSMDGLGFDVWDFQLKETYSLLWTKFISGADLIILLFDASNYKLQPLQHFLDLKAREGQYSKSLVIANKRDLVSEGDIKLIKNELNVKDIKEISLTMLEGKTKIFQLMKEILNLKKSLPPDFSESINEAERLDVSNNLTGAIAKYKELIKICNAYQDFSFVEEFQKKVDSLEKRRDEENAFKKEQEIKAKFAAPKKIEFGTKVGVKNLPTVKALPLPGAKNKPVVKNQPKPSVQPPIKAEPKKKGLSLSSKDFKISLDKVEEEKKRMQAKKEKSLRPIQFPLRSEANKEDLTKELMSNKALSFSERLQKLIEAKGSTLSSGLCDLYIEELLKSLERPLTKDDLEAAAEQFISIENEG